MTKYKINLKDLEYFYDDFERETPLIVLLKIIFSLGIYTLIWIYKLNKRLEKADKSAPNTNRGVVILYLMPTFVILLSVILEFFFLFPKYIMGTYNVLFWSIIIFLSLKYIYDLCECFGKWTGSSGLFWYLAIYPGYFSIILYFLNFYYALPLLFFTIITIPAMQGFLNYKEIKFRELFERDEFNKKSRVQV